MTSTTKITLLLTRSTERGPEVCLPFSVGRAPLPIDTLSATTTSEPSEAALVMAKRLFGVRATAGQLRTVQLDEEDASRTIFVLTLGGGDVVDHPLAHWIPIVDALPEPQILLPGRLDRALLAAFGSVQAYLPQPRGAYDHVLHRALQAA